MEGGNKKKVARHVGTQARGRDEGRREKGSGYPAVRSGTQSRATPVPP